MTVTAMFDVLPTAGPWHTTLYAPVFQSPVMIKQMRWQLRAAQTMIPASLGRNVRADVQWSWQSWLPTPEPSVSGADLDAWVTGKEAIQDTAEKKFTGRTNIKHSWESDHRIVTSASGDMAMVQVSFRPPQQSARRSWLAHRMGRLLHTSQIPSSELAMPTRSI